MINEKAYHMHKCVITVINIDVTDAIYYGSKKHVEIIEAAMPDIFFKGIFRREDNLNI